MGDDTVVARWLPDALRADPAVVAAPELAGALPETHEEELR
jgi:hypothetical protein